MSVTSPQARDFGLNIQVMKRILATHTHYAGDDLLNQLNETKSGKASGGGGASAHVRVDWDAPAELRGYGVVVYFVMGTPEEHRHFSRGRSTKNYTATETQAYNTKQAKGLVRNAKTSPTTPIPNTPKGPLG
jgi:hypothetical protein